MIANNADIQSLLEAYESVCTSELIPEIVEIDNYEDPEISSIEIDSISNVESGVPETRELYRSDNITSTNRDDNNLIIKGSTRDKDIITIIKNLNNSEVTVDVASDNGANLFTYTGRNEGPDSYIQLPSGQGRFGILIKQQDVQ
mgnify:CR=1 FL=1|jgi:hypothetical protein